MLALSSMYAATDSAPVTLACHPQTPSQAIREIDVAVVATTSGSFMLTFCLAGDVSRLIIPEPRSSRRACQLWRHTCFEVFLMEGEGPGYREFNFSPSGEWATFVFSDYRDGAEMETEFSPGIVVRNSRDRLELDAVICQDSLPQGRPLRLGLSAVMEAADGTLSYWALRHPPGDPDFHHIDAFALQMD